MNSCAELQNCDEWAQKITLSDEKNLKFVLEAFDDPISKDIKLSLNKDVFDWLGKKTQNITTFEVSENSVNFYFIYNNIQCHAELLFDGKYYSFTIKGGFLYSIRIVNRPTYDSYLYYDIQPDLTEYVEKKCYTDGSMVKFKYHHGNTDRLRLNKSTFINIMTICEQLMEDEPSMLFYDITTMKIIGKYPKVK